MHAEGSIALFGVAIISKDADGKVALRDAGDNAPVGAAVGALTGSLVGLLGGPVGAALGFGVGGVIGSSADLFNLGVGLDFLRNVSEQLSNGKVAVVAEMSEDWSTPLDTRMSSLGGVVFRQWRTDFEDSQIEKEVQAADAELLEFRREYEVARAESKAQLTKQVEEAKRKLAAASERAQIQVERLRLEAGAKLEAIQEQADRATADAKSRINARMEQMRAEFNARSAKLEQAWDQAKKSLA